MGTCVKLIYTRTYTLYCQKWHNLCVRLTYMYMLLTITSSSKVISGYIALNEFALTVTVCLWSSYRCISVDVNLCTLEAMSIGRNEVNGSSGGRDRWCRQTGDHWRTSDWSSSDWTDWSSSLVSAYCWPVSLLSQRTFFALTSPADCQRPQLATSGSDWRITSRMLTSRGRRTTAIARATGPVTSPRRRTSVAWTHWKAKRGNFPTPSSSALRKEEREHCSSFWRCIQTFELQGQRYISSTVSIARDLTGTGIRSLYFSLPSSVIYAIVSQYTVACERLLARDTFSAILFFHIQNVHNVQTTQNRQL